MMHLETRFVTSEEFKEYTGIDLDAELKNTDNNSNKVEAFIFRITNNLESFIQAQFFKKLDYEYEHFTDYQKTHYKYALMEQILYIFKNGDLTTMSGLENERIVTPRTELRKVSISDNTINELKLCGVWNRHIGMRPSLISWY